MIHLDTSFLIHALVPGSAADKQIRRWLRNEEDLGMSGRRRGTLADCMIAAVAIAADAAVAAANAKDFERLGVETLGVVSV